MAIRGAIEDMTDEEFLLTVESHERQRRESELKLLIAAGEWAARRNPDAIRSERTGAFGEGVRFYGGQGTPKVGNHAGVEFGARMGRSEAAGSRYIATALDGGYRLTMLWERVQRMEVEVSYLMYVARQTRDLSEEAAAYVDLRVAESADGRISWSRFEMLVDAAIKAADPELARQREEEARKRQFARSIRAHDNGIGVFMLRAAWPIVAKLEATVATIARILRDIGTEGTDDELRVKAMALISDPPAATMLLAQYAAWKGRPADPDPETDEDQKPSGLVKAATDLCPETTGEKPEIDWAKLLPAITLFVHTYRGEFPTRIARLEGYGPITDAWVRDYLGPQARFTIRQVLDLEGQAPVDAYEIPDRHRRAVSLMTPADVFPFANATVNQVSGWSSMQIDHTIKWRPAEPGETEDDWLSRIGNYGPMTQFHHNLKTHGGWQVRQPFPGVYVYRDPMGGMYLVDHTGTRNIRKWTTDVHMDLVYSAA